MRVLCLTTLPRIGAGNRLRVEQYVRPLRDMGIELVVSPFFDDLGASVLYHPGNVRRKVAAVLRGLVRRLRDAWRVRFFDLVLVYRESAPIGPPLFERMLASMRTPYVFDFDDAIFLAPIHPSNTRWSWLRHPSRVTETVRQAALVIAGNEYLAEWAGQHNARVTVIGTPVDTDVHRPRAERPPGPLVIGWVGSSTTAPYLRLLDEILDALSERTEFVFRVIGGSYAHPRARVECLPYRLDREADDVATFDIGVLPEPDDPWTRGKGGFKALVYMATGIPVVASKVGVNPFIVVDGETGFCAADAATWIAALEQLAGDPSLRANMGAAGRRLAVDRHSLRVKAGPFAAALRTAGRGL